MLRVIGVFINVDCLRMSKSETRVTIKNNKILRLWLWVFDKPCIVCWKSLWANMDYFYNFGLKYCKKFSATSCTGLHTNKSLVKLDKSSKICWQTKDTVAKKIAFSRFIFFIETIWFCKVWLRRNSAVPCNFQVL